MADGLGSSALSRMLPALVEAAERDADLRRMFGEFGSERRAVLRRVLERGRSRGEMAPGFDLDLASDMLLGPIFGRRLVSRAPLDRAFAVRLVDALMPALRA